jgi:hypothetical protein
MFEEQVKILDADIEQLVTISAKFEEVIFPSYGIGTGMAQLEKRAPKTWAYLVGRLAEIGIENPLIK